MKNYLRNMAQSMELYHYTSIHYRNSALATESYKIKNGLSPSILMQSLIIMEGGAMVLEYLQFVQSTIIVRAFFF